MKTVSGSINPDAIIVALSFILLIRPVIVFEAAVTTLPKRLFIPSTKALIALLAGIDSLPRLRNCSCVRPSSSSNISKAGIPASASCLTSAVMTLPYV